MKTKKMTKRDCYEELERIARVVCEQKVEQDELPAFRLCFKSVLDELARIHDEERRKAEEKADERNLKKYFRT